MKNLILDDSNEAFKVTNFLGDIARETIAGLPLGSSDQTDTGEIAVKTMIVGASAVISPTNLATSAKQDQQTALLQGSLFPYGADEQVFTYIGSTNNINTIVYKKATATIKTRTFTYAAAGAADNDLVTDISDI